MVGCYSTEARPIRKLHAGDFPPPPLPLATKLNFPKCSDDYVGLCLLGDLWKWHGIRHGKGAHWGAEQLGGPGGHSPTHGTHGTRQVLKKKEQVRPGASKLRTASYNKKHTVCGTQVMHTYIRPKGTSLLHLVKRCIVWLSFSASSLYSG